MCLIFLLFSYHIILISDLCRAHITTEPYRLGSMEWPEVQVGSRVYLTCHAGFRFPSHYRPYKECLIDGNSTAWSQIFNTSECNDPKTSSAFTSTVKKLVKYKQNCNCHKRSTTGTLNQQSFSL